MRANPPPTIQGNSGALRGDVPVSALQPNLVPEGNHLPVEFYKGRTLAVFLESDKKFFSKPWPTQLEFSKNEHGEFTILRRYQGGREKIGAKK